MIRALPAFAAFVVLVAPARADIQFDAQQLPPPPWQRGEQFSVVVTARNVGTAPVLVEYSSFPRGPTAIFSGAHVRLQSSTCAEGSLGLINAPPIHTYAFGAIATGGQATCELRLRVLDDAPAITAETVYFPLTQPFTPAQPEFVVLPFGIAPAPASVPTLSSWAVAAIALALAAVAVIRSRLRTRRLSRPVRPAAARPRRRVRA